MAITYWNGGNGNDLLDGSGASGAMQIQGRAGDDTITGTSFADKLYGNEGNDILVGGGTDTLSGGTGTDAYVIGSASLGTGKVSILDFDGAGNGGLGGDVLRLSGFSAAATFTFVRQSGSEFIYLLSDGAVSTEVSVKHDAAVRLVAGDYVFENVVPLNQAPVLTGAQTPLAGGTEDTAYVVSTASLLEGYSDPEGGALTIGNVSVNRGSITDNGDGTWTVTPLANDNGVLTLSYNVIDALGASVAASRAFTLDAVNDAPVLSGTQTPLAAGTVDTAYVLSLANLLEGHSDVDGDALSVSGVTVSLGTVTDNGDGTWTVTPPANHTGQLTLSYSVVDTHGAAVAAGRTLNIIPVNHAPVLSGAQTPLAAGAEDTPYIVSAANLLEGYSDADGDALSVTGLSVSGGTLTNNGNGTWTVTPAANTSGTLTLSYNVVDIYGAAVAASRTLDISPVNDAPVAGTDAATVLASGPRTITLTAASLLANDSDADGNALQITAVGTAAHGTLTLNTNGTPTNYADDFITYTPAAGYAGADTFSYSLSDGVVSVLGAVNVTVQAVPVGTTYLNGGNGNDLLDVSAATTPYQIQGRAGNDTVTGGSGNDKVYGNDGDDIVTGGAGVDTLSGGAGADIYVINKTDLASGSVENILDFNGAGDGAVAGGDVLHLSGFGAGATLAFIRQSGNDHIYEIRDGAFTAQLKVAYAGAVLVAGDYLFVTPASPNNAPVLSGSQTPLAAGTEDQDYAVTAAMLLDGFSDADGDALAITDLTVSHGSVTSLGGGAWTLTPDADYAGPVTLSYRVDDGHGGSVAATRTITFDGVNDAPVLSGTQTPMARGVPDTDYAVTTAKLLQGFSDADGDTLSITGISVDHGTLTAVDGGYSLTPEAGYSGVVTLSYSVDDGQGGSVAATRTITFGGTNNAPVVGSTAVTTRTNDIVSGKLTATDAEGDTVVFSVDAGPAHGTLKLAADGTYIYAPDVGYSGQDSFTILVDDGHDGVTEATITIDVQASAADPSPYRDTAAANALVFVQRDGTSGSFYVAADMARVTKDGSVVADWTTDGVLLDIPQGEGYVLETVTGGVTTTRPLAIGEVVVAAGQSNMEGWFTYAGNSHPAETGIYQWSVTSDNPAGKWISATGAGALAFAETLRLAEPGLPIAYVTGAVGGTKLLPAANVPYWMATGTGSLYQNTIDQVMAASNGEAGLLLWNQGEADAAARPNPLTYAEALKSLFARFDGDIAPDRIVISGLAFTRGNADELRAAQASVAETSGGHILYVPTSPAIETMDDTHLTVPARVLQGTAAALAVLAAEGIAPSGISMQSGGAGNDTLTGGLLIDIVQSGGGDDVVAGMDGDDIVRGEAGNDSITGDAGDDALSGGLDNDTVDGGAGNDDIFGDAGSDVLNGGTGNDLIDGGAGADTLSGQAGNDSYVVDNSGDVIIEVLNEGVDTVYIRATHTMAAFVENLIVDSNDNINGTGNDLGNTMTGGNGANLLSGVGGNDSITGGAGNDTLNGGDGNDTLQGGSGTDQMIGGAGDDTFYVDAGDTVTEASEGGFDTIVTSVAFTLPDNVEAIILGGKGAIGATGSDGANSLTGNGTANVLDGAGGNDTLMGLSGNDSLIGGLGDDNLQGGDGNDTLAGGLGVDILTGDATKRSQDTFMFDSLASMGLGAGSRDTVTDFDSVDIFNFQQIDANTAVEGDQAFTFVGTGAFTAAGQIRYAVVGSDIVISLDVNGDGVADAELLLVNPLAVPTESDFVL